MADEGEGAPHERVHGGVDTRQLRAQGIEPAHVVDFSVNLNPYGPCAPVVEAARAAVLDVYPDASAHVARSAWAEALGCTRDHVAVGHGAADLFWAIARAALSARQRAVIAEPTFSEFRFAAVAAGAQVERVDAFSVHESRLDVAALARAGRGAAALYLCSPNNPTGEHVPLALVRTLAALLPETLIVLDQSFLALSDHADELFDVLGRHVLPDNVLRVRSLTKEFACPGLRIGLCVGAPALIRRVEAMRPTWATSSPALAAITAAAHQHEFVRVSWQHLRSDREAVAALLRTRGYAPRTSDTAYQLVPLHREARVFCQRSLRAGVQLRDGTSFGLPRHVRIAALPEQARARLRHALDVVGSA